MFSDREFVRREEWSDDDDHDHDEMELMSIYIYFSKPKDRHIFFLKLVGFSLLSFLRFICFIVFMFQHRYSDYRYSYYFHFIFDP